MPEKCRLSVCGFEPISVESYRTLGIRTLWCYISDEIYEEFNIKPKDNIQGKLLAVYSGKDGSLVANPNEHFEWQASIESGLAISLPAETIAKYGLTRSHFLELIIDNVAGKDVYNGEERMSAKWWPEDRMKLEYFSVESVDINSRLHRLIPVQIYLSVDEENHIEEIYSAISNLFNAFNFEITEDPYEIEYESIFKRLFARTKKGLSEPEVKERLEKIERAIELKTIDKIQSEVDKAQSEGAAKLIEALSKRPCDAIVKLGSLLVIKEAANGGKDKIVVKNLSQKELKYLEKNEYLLHDVKKILNVLADINTPKPKKIVESKDA